MGDGSRRAYYAYHTQMTTIMKRKTNKFVKLGCGPVAYSGTLYRYVNGEVGVDVDEASVALCSGLPHLQYM